MMPRGFLSTLFVSITFLVMLKPAWIQSANPEQREICVEKSAQPVVINISVNPPSCESSEEIQDKKIKPPGYISSEYGYFKYHPEHKKFNEARKICKSEGGHLAIFNSEAEAKYVASLPDNKYDWAYIGIHDLYEEGKWVTVLDEELHETGYNKWHPGEPNLGTNENCGVVFPDGGLGDYVCTTYQQSFFCEIN